MLELVDDAWREGPLLTGITWDRHVLDGAAQRAATSRLTTAEKAAIAVGVPGANTRELARSCHGSWQGVTGFEGDRADVDFADSRLAFLEVADVGEFRRCVAGFARSENEADRHFGLQLLLRVGATNEDDARLLVEALRADQKIGWLRHLSRSRGDAVRAYLREVVLDDGRAVLPDRVAAARALATLDGLPDEVALFEGMDPDEKTVLWPRTSELILAGRPVDALLHMMQQHPTRCVRGVHLVRDPAVRAYLERIRSDRSSGDHAWATGELALMGDADARAEMEAVLAAGRYRWTDGAEGEHKLLGRSLDQALPPLLDEIESNCCHEIAVRYGVCEELLGIDIPGRTGVGETHRAYVDRTVDAGQPWVWSVLAGRYVPGAR
jgi:hypothetical protein